MATVSDDNAAAADAASLSARLDEIEAMSAIYADVITHASASASASDSDDARARTRAALALPPPDGYVGEVLHVRFATAPPYPTICDDASFTCELAHVLEGAYERFEVPPEKYDELKAAIRDMCKAAAEGEVLMYEVTNALQTTLAHLIWALDEEDGEKDDDSRYEEHEDVDDAGTTTAVPSACPSADRRPIPGQATSGTLQELGVVHGVLLESKRSIFQAHVCRLPDGAASETFRRFVRSLLENRKIQQASHNITAHRYTIPETGAVAGDCDDDGESAAGGRLLHLLELMGCTDVAVCVSRWFGGTLLGPERFKLINNAARQLLEQEGYVPQRSGTSSKKR
ncbi:RWD domain-containing protein [Pycnococcus provasolii]